MSEVFDRAALALAAKRRMLRNLTEPVETLAVGSSHGDYAFDPGFCPRAFNLCSTSQDLRHSLALVRRVGRELPELRKLVIFFSIFSPGHVLEHSPTERDTCLALHEIFDLRLEYLDADLAARAGTRKRELADWSPELEGRRGFLPTFQKEGYPESYGAERRAQEHLRLNARADAMMYLIAALLDAQRAGRPVLIAIPPVRSDYRRACGQPGARLFAPLRQLHGELAIGAPFALINFWEDPDFRDEHFADFDHLDPTGEGARILSSKIANALAAIG